jgi:imidazolonepropionase-like amidohydrolase
VGVVDVVAGVVRPDQTVSIDSGRIVVVSPSAQTHPTPGARIVDGTGKFVIPGLWDAHVHLSYVGACALPMFVVNGVTSVRDAGARMDEVTTWRPRIASGALLGPRIRTAGPNIESGAWLDRAYQIAPPSDQAWHWGQRLRLNGPGDVVSVVDSLVGLGADFIKFRNLPRETFMALAAEARRRGLRLAGHAPKGTTLEAAAAAGLESVEHAETVTLALDSLPDPRRLQTFQAMARAGMFVTPTLITEITLWLTPDSVARAILADSAGLRDPRRRYVSARALSVWEHSLFLNQKGVDAGVDWPGLYRRQTADMRLADQAGVRFLAGTDLGSPVGLYPGAALHEELALLVYDVGLTPVEALRSATTAPAAFFGLGSETGAVAPGMAADLVLLDANPLADIANTKRIRAVMVGGRLVDHAALDATLAAVARDVRTGTGCAR